MMKIKSMHNSSMNLNGNKKAGGQNRFSFDIIEEEAKVPEVIKRDKKPKIKPVKKESEAEKISVLLVNDEPMQLFVMTTLFQTQGYEVTTA